VRVCACVRVCTHIRIDTRTHTRRSASYCPKALWAAANASVGLVAYYRMYSLTIECVLLL